MAARRCRRDERSDCSGSCTENTADSALPISLTITPVDEGLLRRTFRALRIAPKATPLNIRWQENGASGLLSARSVLLDLSLIPAGKYAVKIEVGNDQRATASRLIEVK